MRVQIVAQTVIDPWVMDQIGYTVHHARTGVATPTDADELAEFAGRNCYRSFERPNPDTRTNEGYIGNIIHQQHESVFEHGSVTFYIEASRSVLTELTRHRHLSYSVVSQRYVDVTDFGYHVPPAIQDCENTDVRDLLTEYWQMSTRGYDLLVENLMEAGLKRKPAREAARAVLPNMASSPMVVSGNHRAWKDVLRKRWHLGADAEIRELAGLILTRLRQVAPSTYQDIPEEPFQ